MQPIDSEKLLVAIKSNQRVVGYTHNFYKYPARFSPQFAYEAIQLFSEPGDLILDPFVGGGTAIVEASTLGRKSIGIDISSLATFITKVKTTPMNENQLSIIQQWTGQIPSIKLHSMDSLNSFWEENGYLKNMSDKDTWRVRNLINQILIKVDELDDQVSREFIRCALLRTGQWALDGRRTIPTVNEFRTKLINNIIKMIGELRDYSNQTQRFFSEFEPDYLTILNRSSIGIESEPIFNNRSPRLILMSPPYPGVHILYHRWQIKSRRETPAPFWIADKLDGSGESHYTLGNRQTHQKQEYFSEMLSVFESLSRISDDNTIIVQLLAFTNPVNQLPRYLSVMKKAGFEEIFLTSKKTRKRIWRDVPNRKWYTEFQERQSSSKEVVIIHKKTSS